VTEQKRDFPEFYITSPQPCPYLTGRRERKVFTHLNEGKPPAVVDHLLRTGFRRSQNIAYTPYCDGCNACVSVRVVVSEFSPNRTMRKTLEHNHDIIARQLPAIPTEEQYSLFRDYIALRHGDGGMSDMSLLDYMMMVKDGLPETRITEYRRRLPGGLSSEFHKWPLVGVCLTDRLSDGLSLVYSFYDATLTSRSLGTHMILEQIDQTRRLGLPYAYLGYWIKGSPKMSYKSRFQPQEHLAQGGWIRVFP
jgi:arginyl-tRNA--protein-N-Asp/Glu arginylyltransferase